MEVVESWDELRAESGEIVARINKDKRLALAAATNPVLALAELGYEISREARPSITDRLRLPPATAKRRAELRETITALAGRAIDPDDVEELRQLLFDDLKIRPYPDARGCYPARPSVDPPRKRLTPGVADPLEALRGRHPVIEPLLEYRTLGATAWPFSDTEAYRAIRGGEVEPPVRNPRIRFKRRGARKRGGGNTDG